MGKAEDKIRHLNAVLAAMRSVNHIIVREKDRQALIEKACASIVSTRGYDRAAIVLLDDAGSRGILKGVSGPDPASGAVFGQIEQGKLPICITTLLAGDGDFVVYDRPGRDHRDCPLAENHSDRCVFRGKLEHRGRVYGWLAVTLPPETSFDGEETALLRELAGDIAYALASIESEEKRRQAEEAVERNEAYFRALLRNAADVVTIVDPDGSIRYSSRSSTQPESSSPQKLIGRSAIEMINPDDRAAVGRALAEAAASKGAPVRVQFRSLQPNAAGRAFESIVENHIDDPLIRGIVVTTRDITETRKAEDEKRRLEQELLQAQKMEAIGTLAGGVAHDFNNLLSVIQGYTELAMGRTHEGDPIFGDLGEVREAALRAAALTRQLLVFARRQPVKLVVADLNEVIKNLAKMLARLIGEDVRLDLQLATGLWTIKGDLGNLEQVITNVAVNAREAMPHGGRLTISTSNVDVDSELARTFREGRAGRFVRLTIMDTGTGMTPEVVSHLFEPFFTTKAKGSGLGLAVVYGIVKQHGGWIAVESAPGAGSAFSVYLPSVSQPSGASTAGSPTLAAQPRGRGQSILVVEDEKSLAGLLNGVLRENGYLVSVAGNTRDAMDIFKKQDGKFDLVLSDVVLPDRSGPDLVADIRRLKPDMKVIFTSGYSDDRAGLSAIQALGDPYLQKPYSLAELLETIRQVLGR